MVQLSPESIIEISAIQIKLQNPLLIKLQRELNLWWVVLIDHLAGLEYYDTLDDL